MSRSLGALSDFPSNVETISSRPPVDVTRQTARLPPSAPQQAISLPPASNVRPLLLPLSALNTLVVFVFGSNLRIRPGVFDAMSLKKISPVGDEATPSVNSPSDQRSSG